MNTIWSTYVQSIGTLYLSRRLKFSDRFRAQYQSVFSIDGGSRILEIGCGPGALAQSLHRWYPGAQVFGIDRDHSFIEFARENIPGVSFSEGDATALPFEARSFDVTISNTVAEHIDPTLFYGEQRRVLKENGVCLVLSARKGIHIPAPCIAAETPWEQALWQRAEPYFKQAHQKYHVCAYPQSEAELPRCMEQHGFCEVSTAYLTIALTPDDPRCPRETAHAIFLANRQNDLDNADRLAQIARQVVTPDEIEALKRLIFARYDERLSLYDKGVRQWDTDVSVVMIVRGVKR